MEKIHLSFREQLRLILPYAYHNIKEQFVVVVPVCAYILLFQILILKFGLKQMGLVTGGIVMVFLGLAFFLEGIRIGLVPIGEAVGNTLPKRHSATVVLIFAFLLGVLASIGEPVLGTLQMAGAQLKAHHAPLLYKLLVGRPEFLIATVSLGVGIAVVVGTMRFLYGWSLKPIVLPLILLAIGLTIVAGFDPLLSSAVGLAWDTGAVIVGPVLCPLVLALGVGVCRASGKTSPSLAGFGMVGLISIVPIAAVILLTFLMNSAGWVASHENPEPSSTQIESQPTTQPRLPTSLDFAAFYPRLRTLSLPTELDYAEYAGKAASLPDNAQRVFQQAFALDPNHHTIRLNANMPPEVREAIPEMLRELGYDLTQTGYAIFQRAYHVRIDDEKSLKGSIVLKDTVDSADARSASDIVTRIGYMDKKSLALDSLALGARAILPIFLFLTVVMAALKCKGPPFAQILLSIVFAVIGLFLFFFGLSVGLGAMGNQLGDRLPLAFLSFLPLFPAEAALYSAEAGKIIVVIFALVLGYGATLAEPAFNVLGQQVEDVTQGAFRKRLFSQAVALGVGVGAALGIVSLLYNIPLTWLLLPPYVLLAILTFLNKELFVNIAWDGGAVTTGPVTVPLKLAIGLSLSMATGAGEGFGVLALASAYPVLNILVLGLVISIRERREQADTEAYDAIRL